MVKNRLLASYLDLVRFCAAVAVVLGHARLHAFDASGRGKSLAETAILFISVYAHFAVMTFFVLSGYLVGGKLFRAGQPGFGPKYLVDRATRIYTVVIPAMVIAFALMILQQRLYGHAYQLTSDNCRGTLGQLGGSFLFLHAGLMENPCFDGPYWSLVYEVFYYLFFFAVAVAWAGKGAVRIWAAIAAAGLGIYGLFEPNELWAYSTLWLLGMAAAQKHPFKGRALAFSLAVLGAFVLQTLLRISQPVALREFVVGLAVVGSILLFQRWQPFQPSDRFSRAVAFGAGMSYSLYMFHAPVMNMIRGAAEASGTMMNPMLMYWLYVAAGFGMSLVFWWLFERHTMTIRAALESRLGIGMKHQPIPPNEPAADGPPLPVRQASQAAR